MTEVDQESLGDEEWRLNVEKRLQTLEERPRAQTLKRVQRSKGILLFLLLNVVFSFVNLLLIIIPVFVSFSLSPLFGLVLLPSVFFGGWGIVFAFALYRLGKDTYRHLDTVHVGLIPTLTKHRTTCYVCGRPASHRRAGNWVCDKHSVSR